MMFKQLAFVAIGLAAAWPAAAAPHGKIRLCRQPGVVEEMDHSSVPIPKGTEFDNGEDPKTGDELKPYFRAHTIRDQVLPPKPGCVVLDAVLDDNPAGFRLTTHYPTALPTDLSVVGLSVSGRVVSISADGSLTAHMDGHETSACTREAWA